MNKYKYHILTTLLATLLLLALQASAVFDTGGGTAPGGATSWNNLTDIPPGFADGIDNIGATGTEGTMKIIKINGVQIGLANIVTLDFLGADFDCTESPPTEVNCTLDASVARLGDIAAHEADTLGVHGIANTANLLTTSAIGTSVQAFDTDLANLAAGPSANKITVVPFGTIGSTDVQAALLELSTESIDSTAIHDNQSNEIAPLADKAAPVAADHLLAEDSANANVKVDITVGALTSIYATDAELAGHTTATTGVHGIANTANLLTTSSNLPATQVTFGDPDNVFTAVNVSSALAELNDLIGGGTPNQISSKVHWSQLTGVPSGFADNTDDAGSPTTGTLNTIKSGGTIIGAATIAALDFLNTDFICTEFPTNEVNCSIAPAIARTSDIATHSATTTGVHGIADTSALLLPASIDTSLKLSNIITNETGSGAVVFGTDPVINTPALTLEDGALGAPTADGRIKFNRTTERLQIGDGSTTKSFVPVGTLVDASLCRWNNASGVIDCTASAGGTGTLTTIKLDNIDLATNAIALDFLGADFDCTASPATEINCAIDVSITRDIELAAHSAATTGIHGIVNTANLLTNAAIGSTVQAFDSDLSNLAAGPSADKITTTAFGTISAGTVQSALSEMFNETNDTAAIHDNQANEIAPLADKVSPIAGDHLLGEDSAAGNAKVDITVGSLTVIYATDAELAAHNATTSNIHGILDTSALLTSSSILPGTQVTFGDPDNIFIATTVSSALAELNDLIGGGSPNQATSKVHWSQITGVPPGFADNSDDGPIGGLSNLNIIKLNGTQVGTTDVTTLDFLGSDFDCSESPTNEINCSIDASIARVSALNAHSALTVGVHGIADTALLLTAASIDTSAELSTIITNETGSGSVVFGTSPTINTPVLTLEDGALGAPTADGRIKFNRTTERLQVGDGTATKSFAPVGTLTNALHCTWNSAAGTIDCNTSIGVGTGTLNTIKENDVQIGGATIVALDFFGADFDCTQSPTNEVNCIIADAITRDVELSAHTSASTSVHGITNTALLLQNSSIDSSAELSTILTDETGSGAAVFGTSPSITTPVLILENASGAPPLVDGQIKYDRTLERLQVGDGVTTKSFVPVSVLTDARLCLWSATSSSIECNTLPGGGGLVEDSVGPLHMSNADHGGATWDNNIMYVDALRAGNTFPTLPALYDVFWLLTDNASRSCDEGSGIERTLCIWNGDSWERAAIESDTLQDVVNRGSSVATATVATPLKIGGATNSWFFFQDGAGGLRQRACTNDGTTCTTFAKQLESASDWELINELGTTCGSFDSVTMAFTANFTGGCSPNLVTGPSVGGGLQSVVTASGLALGIQGCAPGEIMRRKWDGSEWECWPSNKHQPAVPAGPTHTMIDSDCGSTIGNTTAATLQVNLIADPTGCTICFFAETNQAIKLEPNGVDNFIVSGLAALVGGDSITLAAGIGNNVCIQGKNASTWWAYLGTGAVTDTN